MINNLPAYPAYRDSQLPWVGEIPAHWKQLRTKYFLREIDDRSSTGCETLLSMRQHRGLVPHNDVSKKEIGENILIGYKRTKPNDLVLNRMQASNGMFFRSSLEGLVSPDYAVFRPLIDVATEYFGMLFRSPSMRAKFRAESKGLGTGTSGFLRLYSDRFASIAMPVPPRDEQDKIVAFLHAQDRQIARFIRDKRRLIELLNEQKQTIIHRAVTCGLDPNVRLRPSDIDWLGDVPEHWEQLKLKFVAKIVGGSTPASNSPECWDGDIVWITPKDVSKTDRLYTSQRKITESGLKSCSTTLVPKGSIVITSRAPVGNLAVAEVPLCTNQGCKAIVPNERKLISLFAFFVLQLMKDHLQSKAKGTTFTEISTTAIANEFVPVPSPPEQELIVQSIQERFNPLDQLIDQVRMQIEAMKSFRERLISDVVTGKLDLRGWTPAPEDLAADDEGLAVIGDDEEIPAEEDGDAND